MLTATPSKAPGAPAEPTLPPSDLAPAGTTRWGRPTRLLAAVLTVTFVAVLLLNTFDAGALESVWGRAPQAAAAQPFLTTLVGRPPQRLGTGDWQSVSLPRPGDQIEGVAVSPTDPATIYACAGPARPNGIEPSGPLEVWRTSDAGGHWSLLGTPSLNGQLCDVSIAFDAPQRVVLTTMTLDNAQRPCTRMHVYLSDDGGGAWQSHVLNPPIPAGAQPVWCSIVPAARHLFASYSYTSARGSQAFMQVARLLRSDDDGATWQAADGDLGATALFMPQQLADDDTLVASVRDISPTAGVTGGVNDTTLWITRDAGSHWSRIGLSAGDTFLLAPPGAGTATPTASHPWYVLRGEQVNYVTVYQTTNGVSWARLPLLPVPGSQATATPNIREALTAMPDGRLIVLGGDPHAAATSSVAPHPDWLWIWNPQTNSWSYFDSPITVNDRICGLCPAHFTTVGAGPDGKTPGVYVWIYDTPAHGDVLYRVFVPAMTTQP